MGDLSDIEYYGQATGIHAFAVGTTSCNIGTSNLLWIAGTNQHPVIAQNMYRLKDGRFEQIGMSWLKHGFTALRQNLCSTCSGQGGTVLGIGCSDPYVASLNGSQGRLGPRNEVNAATGAYVYNTANWPPSSGTLGRRLQVAAADIAPAQNPGARYFVEGQYVTADDSAGSTGGVSHNVNNTSYREWRIPTNLTIGNYGAGSFVAATQRTKPAIQAWADNDPTVQIAYVDVPGDGRFWYASKVTDNGDATWTYEYAIQNLTSDRSGAWLSVPMPAGVVPESVGFHDVPYHSGDGVPTNPAQPATTARNYDGTDWATQQSGGRFRWSTEPYSANTNANALRWGTMYNFRFTVNAQPAAAALDDASLGLFKPSDTGPASIALPGLKVPSDPVARTILVQLDSTLPTLVSPNRSTEVRTRVAPRDDAVQPGSVTLHYRMTTDPAAPFLTAPMTPEAPGSEWYTGVVPPPTCGETLSYYVSAVGSAGGTVTAPLEGAAGPKVVAVGSITDSLRDDFETDKGWLAGVASDNATTGRWVRGDPVGTSINLGSGSIPVQPENDHSADGTRCWFTGQGVGGGAATSADVDGGTTTLLSPAFDVSTGSGYTLSYWRWFVNGISTVREEVLRVELSSDAGQTWVPLETVGPTGAEVNGGWFFKEFDLAGRVPAGAGEVYVRFVAQDLGTDQVIEAAIDDVRVSRTGCDSTCRADYNGVNGLDAADLFEYIADWFADRGDFNRNGDTDLVDMFVFIAAWSAGCP